MQASLSAKATGLLPCMRAAAVTGAPHQQVDGTIADYFSLRDGRDGSCAQGFCFSSSLLAGSSPSASRPSCFISAVRVSMLASNFALADGSKRVAARDACNLSTARSTS